MCSVITPTTVKLPQTLKTSHYVPLNTSSCVQGAVRVKTCHSTPPEQLRHHEGSTHTCAGNDSTWSYWNKCLRTRSEVLFMIIRPAWAILCLWCSVTAVMAFSDFLHFFLRLVSCSAVTHSSTFEGNHMAHTTCQHAYDVRGPSTPLCTKVKEKTQTAATVRAQSWANKRTVQLELQDCRSTASKWWFHFSWINSDIVLLLPDYKNRHRFKWQISVWHPLSSLLVLCLMVSFCLKARRNLELW